MKKFPEKGSPNLDGKSSSVFKEKERRITSRGRSTPGGKAHRELVEGPYN